MGDSTTLNYPGAFDDGGTSVTNQYAIWTAGGPVPVDPTGGVYTITGTQAPASSGASSVTNWLNSNAKTVLIGAGVFLGVMLLAGGRR